MNSQRQEGGRINGLRLTKTLAPDSPARAPNSIEVEIGRAETPVALPEADPTSQALAVPNKPSLVNVEQSEVSVAPNLTDLVAGKLETIEDRQAFIRRRNLNEVVHGVLLFGLAISTTLMLIGLGLDLVRHHEMPTAVPSFEDVFRRVIEVRASGFLALGLLALIATPILRVIGSIFAFLYERDWRYAAITFLVLVVVGLSVLLGQG